MDERLRLIVELQNKASAEIRRLGKDLDGVKPGAGAKATANWFQTLEGASTSANKALRPLASGLGTIGVSGLAAGLSVAGLIAQFRDLAKAMPALQELSRQTGISKTELERLKQTAANLNIDPSKMTAAIGSFSSEMVQFSKQSGELYAEMQNGASGLARKIATEWKDHPEQALKDYLGWLAEIPAAAQRAGKSAQEGVQIQRYWAQKGLGDADMAQIVGKGMSGFQDAYRQAAQDVGQITDEMVRQSEAFDRSITRFDASWNALKRDLGSEVLPALTATTDGLRKLFDEVKNDPELAGIGAASLGALYARRRIVRAVSGGASGGISPVTAAKVEGAAVTQKGASVSFAEAVAEFKVAVAEFRAKGGLPAPNGQASGDPEKPGSKPSSTSFDNGRALLAAAGLAGVVVNAPGLDEAGERERDANAKALETFGETLRKFLGVEWLQGEVDAWRSGGSSASAAGATPPAARQLYTVHDADEDRLTRARDVGGPPRTFGGPGGFHPDDDRASRARASDLPDRSLDGFVVGALEKPILRLSGTLKTAAASLDGNVRSAAFHPTAFNGGGALDPQAIVAAGTKEGVLAAFRELAGMQDLDGKGAGGGGFTPTAFGGGGMGGGRSAAAAGRAPSIRYGRQHDSAPYDDGGATPTGAHDPLKDLIAQHETGGTGAAGYDTVYGHAEQPGSKMHALAPPKPLTQMTIAEVLAYQREMKPRAGSEAFPVGRAQWVEKTLRGLTRGMDQNQLFSPELQEKLFDRSIAGRMGQGPGGFRSEWASLGRVSDAEIGQAMQGHRDAVQKAVAAAPSASTGPRGVYPEWMDDKSKREMAGINAPLARDLIAASAETGAHFRILQGLRTEDEAAANARRGVGVRNSQHRWGAAADLKLTDGAGHDLDRNDPAYERFATAFERASRAHGGSGRWLGHVPGWAWDRAHFDQGLNFGQTHKRDPYGAGGPTAGDIAAGNKEIFSGPDNPFLRAAKPLDAAADKLKAVVAPMPAVEPEPPRQPAMEHRVTMDPLHVQMTHREDGRTRVAVRHGEGVKVTLRTAPTMVPTA